MNCSLKALIVSIIVLITVTAGRAQSVPSGGVSTESSNAVSVQRLQRENESLRKENQELRRLLAKPDLNSTTRTTGANQPSGTPLTKIEGNGGAGEPSAKKFSLSSTGKRHNSSCRYYDPNKGCSATDGVACKICGG